MKEIQNNIEADKLRGVLMTRTAIKTLVPEDIVERVIMFQFKDAKEAVLINEQIEISGLGKFMTSPSKIKRKIEHLLEIMRAIEAKIARGEESAKKREYYAKLIEANTKTLTFLQSKKGGYEN